MLKKLIPSERASDVYHIDFAALRRRGYRAVIFDVDNTLESHRVALPGERSGALVHDLMQQGYAVCFLSNNVPERVERFNSALGAHIVGKAGKPKKRGYRQALSLMGSSPCDTVMVGDQIFTDIYGGNRMGLYTILVEPIEPVENSFFIIKRFFERRVLRAIDKKSGRMPE